MNAEKIFDVMENIDEQYIIEAHQKNVIKNKKQIISTYCFFINSINFTSRNISTHHHNYCCRYNKHKRKANHYT